MRIAIVNYGVGNLGSVYRALEECGGTPFITTSPEDLKKADGIILPGVGSFGDAMSLLRSSGYEDPLNARVLDDKIPFLGICLGMQMLATIGLEAQTSKGLNWIEGDVVRLTPQNKERIPHVGWNEAHFKEGSRLFKGIPQNTDFYFVHSFHISCVKEHTVSSITPYCGGFVSSLEHENVFGVQFHPEKSQKAGFSILKNFIGV